MSRSSLKRAVLPGACNFCAASFIWGLLAASHALFVQGHRPALQSTNRMYFCAPGLGLRVLLCILGLATTSHLVSQSPAIYMPAKKIRHGGFIWKDIRSKIPCGGGAAFRPNDQPCGLIYTWKTCCACGDYSPAVCGIGESRGGASQVGEDLGPHWCCGLIPLIS